MCFKKHLLDYQNLQTNGFEQQAEILCKLTRKGGKFFEVPVNYSGRTKSEGKKIRYYHMFPVLLRILIERIKP